MSTGRQQEKEEEEEDCSQPCEWVALSLPPSIPRRSCAVSSPLFHGVLLVTVMQVVVRQHEEGGGGGGRSQAHIRQALHQPLFDFIPAKLAPFALVPRRIVVCGN
jgi:hypothetical protein